MGPGAPGFAHAGVNGAAKTLTLTLPRRAGEGIRALTFGPTNHQSLITNHWSALRTANRFERAAMVQRETVDQIEDDPGPDRGDGSDEMNQAPHPNRLDLGVRLLGETPTR